MPDENLNFTEKEASAWEDAVPYTERITNQVIARGFLRRLAMILSIGIIVALIIAALTQPPPFREQGTANVKGLGTFQLFDTPRGKRTGYIPKTTVEYRLVDGCWYEIKTNDHLLGYACMKWDKEKDIFLESSDTAHQDRPVNISSEIIQLKQKTESIEKQLTLVETAIRQRNNKSSSQ